MLLLIKVSLALAITQNLSVSTLTFWRVENGDWDSPEE
jgi:hypothetical protein